MAAGESKRDVLAIVIALVSLVAQAGLWFYWGGKLEARIDATVDRVVVLEQGQREGLRTDGEHQAQIAVSVAQQTEVIRRLDSIDRKLEPRP